MGRHRCEGPRRRPSRFVRRYAPSRQAQPDYTPHVDCGDNVIVINADKVVFTGRKRDQKMYYRHTGYPAASRSGRRSSFSKAASRSASSRRRSSACSPAARCPARSGNLRVYKGAEHPHAAQQPEALDVAALNPKNVSG